MRSLRRAYDQVPQRFHNALENLDVAVEEWPDAETMDSMWPVAQESGPFPWTSPISGLGAEK